MKIVKIILYVFILTYSIKSNTQLTTNDIAKKLRIPKNIASRIIERIQYIDQINTQAAPYYPILSHFLNKRGYTIGCEIGVFTGGHAQFILANTNIKKLYCIDQYVSIHTLPIVTEGFQKNYFQACWDTMYYYVVDKLSPFKNRAQLIRSSSKKAASIIANHSLDFIFIDGDHSYSAVLADCTNYYDKIRSGGMIAGDDYNIPDVEQALLDFFNQKNLTINIYPGQKRFWWVEKP